MIGYLQKNLNSRTHNKRIRISLNPDLSQVGVLVRGYFTKVGSINIRKRRRKI
jgi:hypothetical protein